ncbi:pimeloyl-ACP methyl ester carboxylesterase [Arthrobacter sp. SLBN-100]|uniref:alpha/beta fold hydrolase n=1 Tax=Arthrobacter sp. SLBN-100 TaxID=2768450 RepID=UPI001150AB3A|nr:alpha/beta hydrolase [Arthrobacter sp. SLBN-100]TQJ62148.1 pimeloyl-ACP methyl ester carboxylesterase [Arthrobacter sp. SLBN-100]
MTAPPLEEKWAFAGSFRTRYFEGGRYDAPVLVLLHDGAWGGSAPVTWGALAPLLTQDYRVIAPDLLGFGGTDKAVFLSESPYDFRIRHIFDLLKALDVKGPIHLMGNSFGGSLALRAAAQQSQSNAEIFQIRSVVSVNGSGGPWRTDLALSELGRWDGTKNDLSRIVSLLIDDGPHFAAQVDLRVAEAQKNGHYRAVKAATIPLPETLRVPRSDEEWPSALSNSTTPILLIGGSRDPLLKPEWMQKIKSAVPNCESSELDCKHAPNIDHVDELMAVITPFLSQQTNSQLIR